MNINETTEYENPALRVLISPAVNTSHYIYMCLIFMGSRLCKFLYQRVTRINLRGALVLLDCVSVTKRMCQFISLDWCDC